MLRNQSLSCCNSICLSSCNLNLSAMHLFESSMALLKSLSSLLISVRMLAISVSDLDLGVIERSSRRSCSFSWIRSNLSLSDSKVPGDILSSRAASPFNFEKEKNYVSTSFIMGYVENNGEMISKPIFITCCIVCTCRLASS